MELNWPTSTNKTLDPENKKKIQKVFNLVITAVVS